MDVLRGRSSEGPGLRRSVEETTGANGVHLESGPASVLHLPRGPAALHAPAGAGRAPLHIPQGGLWAGKKKKKSPGFQNITVGLFHFYVVLGS